MKRILPLIIFLIPCISLGSETALKADKNQTRLFEVPKTYEMGNIKGELKLLTFEQQPNSPSRVVIGVSDGNPGQHAFQIVFERISNSEEYWLAYEYIRDGVTQIRIDIQSGIKLNETIPFDIFWHKTGRLQVTVFENSHFPYTNLKSKTPFFLISSGSASVSYNYGKAHWTEGAPN